MRRLTNRYPWFQRSDQPTYAQIFCSRRWGTRFAQAFLWLNGWRRITVDRLMDMTGYTVRGWNV